MGTASEASDKRAHALPPQTEKCFEGFTLKILHINANDPIYGADRAAYRIHRALVEHGLAFNLHSSMRVINKAGDDPTVCGGIPHCNKTISGRILARLHRRRMRGFTTGNPVLHTFTPPEVGLGQELLGMKGHSAPDLIHLHWLGNDTLSIQAIGRLDLPLVWTLHDQWAFCGAEHYTTPPGPNETSSSDERFAVGYTPASRPSHESGPDLNRDIWLQKKRSWKRPIEIVCPSTWMTECAGRSALMGHWPITTIPYPIDLDYWAPMDQNHARRLLRLPLDRPLVLFGAVGGTIDPRKGADLLLEALQILRTQFENSTLAQMELVIFGQSRPGDPPNLEFPVHYTGRIQDDLRLRLLYAACDVMVVPSRQEAFGQTASEAQACGTPVVAFRTGGLVDIVDDHVTGILAEPFDPESLAFSVYSILINDEQREKMKIRARKRAIDLWNPLKICKAYANIYQESSAYK
jgi:glycosyltransferase involved in cell wall biosynthesis